MRETSASKPLLTHRKPSKYPPAEPGALVLEPLEAACPCCFNSAALLRRGMSQHHVSVTISLTSSLGRQRLHNCITAPRSGASAFKPSIDAIPFVCLAVGRVAAIEPGGVDPRICQTFAASPAEPGELPLWFRCTYSIAPSRTARCDPGDRNRAVRGQRGTKS